MASENRQANHPLIRTLLEEAPGFSFFQAVRLLQRAFPDAPPPGRQGPADREVIRFSPSAELGFPTADLVAVRRTDGAGGGPRFEVETAFLGLYGSVSPLPTNFTERLLEEDDQGLQKEFLDLFLHRVLSLFFRVWEKYRFDVQFSPRSTDYYSRRILALLSVDPERFPADHRVPALRLLGLPGLLTQIPRSAPSLRAALSEYFEGVPIEVESCVRRWLPIAPDQCTRVGSQNCVLGRDLSLGDRLPDVSGTFRVAVGPVGLEDFLSFLPPGERTAELREIVDLMNGDALDFELELHLREDEIPELQLSSPRAMLGWSTWLGRREGMESRVRFLVKGWFHGRG